MGLDDRRQATGRDSGECPKNHHICNENEINYYYYYYYYYQPQWSCGQGYVFTRVCDSVHRGGLRRTPLDQVDPPRQGDPPAGRTPLAGRTPPGTRQTPLLAGRTPPEWADPPDQGEPPRDQADTPQQGEPPSPGRRLQHTVNERPVRILLECILVIIIKSYIPNPIVFPFLLSLLWLASN